LPFVRFLLRIARRRSAFVLLEHAANYARLGYERAARYLKRKLQHSMREYFMAAAHNYLNDNPNQANNRVVAFFSDRDDAYQALSELKDANFHTNEIGLAVGRDNQNTSATSRSGSDTDDTSFWQKVKDFFSGESDESEHHSDFRDATGHMGWSDERYGYYEEGIASGGALVTVTGNRIEEARRILQENGGELRDSGFEATTSTPRSTVTEMSGNRNTTPINRTTADAAERRIQLRGEMLRTYKDRVQRGEVRLRKEVVTENRSVEVPVTHEELVVERTAGTGQTATGEIGTGEEIRVPLSEERVRVEKQPVVTEEVRVGKRQVQGSKQVSDQVRHEELRVDKEGEVNTDKIDTPRKRKNPAA